MKYQMLALALTIGIAGTPRRSPAQEAMAAPASTNTALSAVPIHQEVDFAVGPERLYEALLDDTKFTAFSQGVAGPATINRDVGGAFSLFGGYIVGRNLELIPNRRIVQAWRAGSWPDGVYSIVRFELQAQGTGTHLVFDHTGFPQDQREHLVAGWEEHYWALLKRYFR
ncbi:MAG: SRPBCC domain-containing protein [Gemmatimonadales bacterium]